MHRPGTQSALKSALDQFWNHLGPHPSLQDCVWWALYKAENVLLGSWLRKKALKEIMKHIHYEVRGV